MIKRFASVMITFVNELDISSILLVENYSWASLSDGSELVIDVSDSKGNISAMIARFALELRFVVEDLLEAMLDAQKSLS